MLLGLMFKLPSDHLAFPLKSCESVNTVISHTKWISSNVTKKSRIRTYNTQASYMMNYLRFEYIICHALMFGWLICMKLSELIIRHHTMTYACMSTVTFSLKTGIEGQPQTLTPKIAFYIGSGLAKLLAERFNKPVNELRVSVSIPLYPIELTNLIFNRVPCTLFSGISSCHFCVRLLAK